MPLVACLGLLMLYGPVESTWKVEVTSPQQPKFTTKLVGLDADSVEIEEGSQRIRRPISSILSVTFVENLQPTPPKGKYSLQLVDGSSVSCNSIASDGRRLSVTSGSQQFDLSARFALALQLRELNDGLQAAFDAISGSVVNSDTLIVLQPGGSLSKIEGIVNSISSDAVSFEFSGTTVEVPYAKLAGIRFYSSVETARPKLKAIVRDTQGNEWYAANLQSSGEEKVSIELQCGQAFEMPIAKLAVIDYSFGSTRYLADMEPMRRNAERRFDFPIDDLRIDAVLGATPEKPLNIPGKAIGPSLRFVGSSEATYRIPEGFTRLVGSVELAPPGEKYTPCRVQVLLEGQLLWDQVLDQTQMPMDFDLEVQGGQRLRLVVTANSRLATGDVVVWREPRLLK